MNTSTGEVALGAGLEQLDRRHHGEQGRAGLHAVHRTEDCEHEEQGANGCQRPHPAGRERPATLCRA
jgi:hypothetical protein